jgi:hypothetical protein
MTEALQVRSFLAWTSGEAARSAAPSKDLTGATLTTKQVGALQVAYVTRSSPSGHTSNEPGDIVLGDTADIDRSDFLKPAAGGVPIRYDAATQRLQFSTSMVGMPPMYVYRGEHIQAITSDVHLLLTIPGLRLELEPNSVAELGYVGHPVEHRSMFKHLTLIESGVRATFDGAGRLSIDETWRLPDAAPLTWPQFIEAQIAAFEGALRDTELQRSFLSLTAGLDTRTVFSTLAAQHRLLPAATMSGARLSLDAMIARRLCQAYGVEHMVITFANDFTSALPRYVESASLLSGGLASLDQATEVHFYNQLDDRFQSRLSGNLGNQVGRGGTEGVSLRGANAKILSPRFHAAAETASRERGHWLLSRLNDTQRARLEFILRNETVFTSVGNYSIGNHYAAQQSPYGTRELIETLAQRPTDDAGAPSSSKLKMRLRDLRHRFLGEPEERSFQRTLVKRDGGFASECPVNWGWKPSGGISPTGFALGGATFVGMFARAKGLDNGVLRGPLNLTGLPSLHDFRESRRWLKESMHQFARDLLTSQETRNADLFEANEMTRVMDDHFAGRSDAYHTIVFAMDLALANRVFVARSVS